MYKKMTKKKPKDKTVIMIAVGKMKPKKNGRKTWLVKLRYIV